MGMEKEEDKREWGRMSRNREIQEKEERMGAGGGSNRIIHHVFGELVCLHEVLQAAIATYSTDAF